MIVPQKEKKILSLSCSCFIIKLDTPVKITDIESVQAIADKKI